MSVGKEIADKFKNYLSGLSKEGFYRKLSETVELNKDGNVVGSGLTKYITDERPELLNNFIDKIQL